MFSVLEDCLENLEDCLENLILGWCEVGLAHIGWVWFKALLLSSICSCLKYS
jgi:hypothetical protein